MKSVYVCEVLRAVSSIRYVDVYACVYFICYIYIYIYICYVYICMLYTWNSPGQNPGVGGRSLLLGIFPTQGSNPDVPYCRRILYQLSYQGSPRTLQWVAYPFSSGSSQPRNWPGSPALQLDTLPAELPGKPKNTAMSSLSLLQQIFPAQESTRVSCIAVGFFTSWTAREALHVYVYTHTHILCMHMYDRWEPDMESKSQQRILDLFIFS